MKRLLSILVCSIIAFTAQANKFTGIEPLDSASYAIGYQYTASLLIEDTGLMRNKNDYEEYIRGLQDNILDYALYADSSYVMSYSVGGMLGVFMTDGHSNKDYLALFRYVIEGLRKASEGRLVLPTDTIEAMAVLERHGRKDKNFSDIDEKAKREFFTAYGIMKAFQPGIQEYINELKPGTSVILNRQAYAKGMADVLEACINGEPKSAYELGKTISFSAKTILMGHEDFTTQSFHSFIAGAKAALDLGEQLIAKKVLEEMIKKERAQDSVVAEESNNNEVEKITEYASSLDIELSTPYSVNWTVTASKVATEQSPASRIFHDFLQGYEIKDSILYGVLMVQGIEKTSALYDAIDSKVKGFPLPKGYKWFYGKREDETLILGIMDTSDTFNATACEALVELSNRLGVIGVPFSFDKAGAKMWAKFTKANIGNNIAMFINGIFASAPRINSQITGGRCSVNGLPAEDVNRLFKGAVPVKPTVPTDSIEIE